MPKKTRTPNKTTKAKIGTSTPEKGKVKLQGEIGTQEGNDTLQKPLKTTEIAKKRLEKIRSPEFIKKTEEGNRVYEPEDIKRITEHICQELSSGRTLIEILDKDNVISRTGLYYLQRQDSAVLNAISEARTYQQHMRVEQKDTIIQQTEDRILSGQYDKVANALSSLTKTQLESIQWNAERIAPRQFSQKMQIEHVGEHITVQINIGVPAPKSKEIDVTPDK